MGWDIKIKGTSYRDDSPKYCQTYTMTSHLNEEIPLLEQTLFFGDSKNSALSYKDPRLSKIISTLDIFLENYKPEVSIRELSSFGIMRPDKGFVGTAQGNEEFDTVNPPNISFLKNAAYQLREVLQYAIQKKRDLKIS